MRSDQRVCRCGQKDLERVEAGWEAYCLRSDKAVRRVGWVDVSACHAGAQYVDRSVNADTILNKSAEGSFMSERDPGRIVRLHPDVGRTSLRQRTIYPFPMTPHARPAATIQPAAPRSHRRKPWKMASSHQGEGRDLEWDESKLSRDMASGVFHLVS